MNNTEDGKPPEKQPAANTPVPPPIPPQNQKVLGHTEQHEANNAPQVTVQIPQTTRPVEWLQLGANGLLTVIGIFAICIYGGQLGVMRETLSEVKSGSTDTHNLAVAADKQAAQATLQVQKMGESLSKTDSLIVEATAQSRATNRLATEAKRSADIATEALEAQLRPYLQTEGEVTVDPTSHIDDWDPRREVRPVSITFKVKLRNYGASPATFATGTGWTPFGVFGTGGLPRYNLLREHDKCQEAVNILTQDQQRVVFTIPPGEEGKVQEFSARPENTDQRPLTVIGCLAYGWRGKIFTTDLMYDIIGGKKGTIRLIKRIDTPRDLDWETQKAKQHPK